MQTISSNSNATNPEIVTLQGKIKGKTGQDKRDIKKTIELVKKEEKKRKRNLTQKVRKNQRISFNF